MKRYIASELKSNYYLFVTSAIASSAMGMRFTNNIPSGHALYKFPLLLSLLFVCLLHQPLRRALGRMGAPNLIPDSIDTCLSYSVITYLKKLKNQVSVSVGLCHWRCLYLHGYDSGPVLVFEGMCHNNGYLECLTCAGLKCFHIS